VTDSIERKQCIGNGKGAADSSATPFILLHHWIVADYGTGRRWFVVCRNGDSYDALAGGMTAARGEGFATLLRSRVSQADFDAVTSAHTEIQASPASQKNE
jgi:hypothetical protein